MIEGLKLTMTGDEVRKRLGERIKHHERLVAHYTREAKRDPDPDDEEDFVLPEHQCDYLVQLHRWRAEALGYIREHVEGGEVYRLGAGDLEFGEILPEKPGIVEQDEFERENRVGLSMEQIAKEIGRSRFGASELMEAFAEERLARRSKEKPPRAGKKRARAGKD